MDDTGFTINASRIGAKGGLRTYAEAIFQCCRARFEGVNVVVPRGVAVPEGVKATAVPSWLSSSSRVSKMRPLLWLVYSAVRFPCKRSRRVLSTTHHSLPFYRSQILTVHDLRPYFEADTWVQRHYFHRMLGRALRRCDGIITVSETSKRDIIEVYGINEGKIFVVPNAVDIPEASCEKSLDAMKAETPYILMVGASWKHKNAMEVLEVHESWAGDFRLKLVTGVGQYCDQLKERSSRLGISAKIDFLHGICDAELAGLYRGCSALVYPSRMEGFGLPPLEAMAFGKPAIVSDIPVFRELFGTAPYFVKLGSSASWNAAFSELRRPEADSAATRREQGLAVASSFSRERMCLALTTALEAIWHLAPRQGHILLEADDAGHN